MRGGVQAALSGGGGGGGIQARPSQAVITPGRESGEKRLLWEL